MENRFLAALTVTLDERQLKGLSHDLSVRGAAAATPAATVAKN